MTQGSLALSGSTAFLAQACLPTRKLLESHRSSVFYNTVCIPLPLFRDGVWDRKFTPSNRMFDLLGDQPPQEAI